MAPQSTPTPSPSLTTPTPPERFQPLLAILAESKSAGRDQPLRCWVGEELRRRYTRSLYTSFRDYAADAERLGLVTLGKGAIEGTEWIRLVRALVLSCFREALADLSCV